MLSVSGDDTLITVMWHLDSLPLKGIGGMMLCWLTWAETAGDGDDVVHCHPQMMTHHCCCIEWGPTGLTHLLTWHCWVVLVVVGWSLTMMVYGGGNW